MALVRTPESAGLRILLRFYKERYWDENNEEDESVRPTSFYDVSEYLVAKAVVAAIASATAADGSSELDAVWFLKLCVEQFCSAWEAYDDRGLLSSMCSGLGLLKAPKVSARTFCFAHEICLSYCIVVINLLRGT